MKIKLFTSCHRQQCTIPLLFVLLVINCFYFPMTSAVKTEDQSAMRHISNVEDVKQEQLVESLESDVETDVKKVPIQPKVVDVRLMHAFVKAIVVIIVSEIGDKTFFIAAIFAMKHPRSTVFAGAISALGLMTFLSVVLGYATTVIPYWLTFYGSVILFIGFGAKMLHEGISMDPQGSQEEIEEVQAELKKKDEEMERSAEITQDVETGIIRGGRVRKLLGFISPILVQSFTLTFLAEWGDRSQITTIVLAASENAFGVFLGAVIGHALCTGLAVVGGRMIAQKISVRTVTIIGGVFFILNAIFSIATGPQS